MLKSIIFASNPPHFCGILILNSGGVFTSAFIKFSAMPLTINIMSFNNGILSSIIPYNAVIFA